MVTRQNRKMIQLRLGNQPQDHVAIMRRSWKLIEKILAGEKTVESRWFKHRGCPWGKVSVGDTIYFKDSAGPVRAKARVTKVLQFESLNTKATRKILERYGRVDLGFSDKIPEEILDYLGNKDYCLLVFFDSVEKVEPFLIDKSGFGTQAAWLITDDIERIRLKK